MDYQDTLTYLYNSVPMFQQVGGSAYKEGLENTLTLDAHFEHPHRSFRSIHVAADAKTMRTPICWTFSRAANVLLLISLSSLSSVPSTSRTNNLYFMATRFWGYYVTKLKK